MAVREFMRWSFFMCVTMIYSVDSIAFYKGTRWIALGQEIEESDERGRIEFDRYNTSLSVSSIVDVAYNTRNGKRINSIIASASNMNGFVSLVNGGLEEDHVTIRYTTENGNQDVLYLFIESYKIRPFVINDNSVIIKNVTVVTNDIRNWTANILK